MQAGSANAKKFEKKAKNYCKMQKSKEILTSSTEKVRKIISKYKKKEKMQLETEQTKSTKIQDTRKKCKCASTAKLLYRN